MSRRRRWHRGKSLDLKWDRVGVSVPDEGAAFPSGEEYLWMLMEDVGMELWGQFHRIGEEVDSNAVRLEGASEPMKELLCDAISHGSSRLSLASILGDFCKMVGQAIILDGAAHYEITMGWKTVEGNEQVEAAKFSWLPTKLLVRRRGILVESIPREKANRWDCPEQIEIPAQKVMIFRPPRRWRNPVNSIRQCLPMLKLSEQAWMANRIQKMGTGSQNGAESFSDVIRSYRIATARVLSPIGWIGRGLWRDYIADYQLYMWQLRWYEFCIELRQSILDELGRGIEMIASARGEKVNLVCEGLPCLSDVEKARSKLRSGNSSFSEILRPFEKLRPSRASTIAPTSEPGR